MAAAKAMARWPRLAPGRPSVVTVAVLAIVAGALALRLFDLGARAIHHDESLHGAYSYYLAQGDGYRHNPLMHGPFQFHIIAALFRLFGDGDTMLRIPAALAGTALVATPLLLRRWLGAAGTVIAALLLALSPSLLYYSRFARNDLFIATWTVLMVAAVWRYREHRGRGDLRWLALLAAGLALSFATKETAYLTAAMLLIYLNVTMALALVRRRGAGGRRKWLEMAALLPSAWALAALWRPLGRRLVAGPRPREADLLVVLGTLVAPLLAAGVQFPLEVAGVRWEGGRELVGGTATVVALLAGSAAVGLAWDWKRWLPLAAIFYAITVPLYATGFTHIDGIAGLFWNSLDYWLDQQDVQRGGQPWFYYLMMLPLYELLPLAVGLGGSVWLLRRGGGLARLLAWWFGGTLLALAAAGEKMPWLTVHLAVPLALLAALALGAAVEAAPRTVARWRRAGVRAATPSAVAAGGATAVLVLLTVFSLRTAAGVTFGHADRPVEPLIYTQTSPEIPALMRRIEILADAGEGRDRLPVTVDKTSSFTWPWAWYLRHFPRAGYLDSTAILAGNFPDGGVLIVSNSTLGSDPRLRDGFAQVVPYRHRWWFREEGYRGITVSRLWRGLANGSLMLEWIDFYARRGDSDQIASIDGAVLFPIPVPEP